MRDDASVGNLPLVNAVLLGYPFAYCVSAMDVNDACRRLSTGQLLLLRCVHLWLSVRLCTGHRAMLMSHGGAMLAVPEGRCHVA
jgi:hypothetical protein